MSKNTENLYTEVSLIIAIIYWPIGYLAHYSFRDFYGVALILTIIMFSPLLGIVLGIIGVIKCRNHKHSKLFAYLSIFMNIGVFVKFVMVVMAV